MTVMKATSKVNKGKGTDTYIYIYTHTHNPNKWEILFEYTAYIRHHTAPLQYHVLQQYQSGMRHTMTLRNFTRAYRGPSHLAQHFHGSQGSGFRVEGFGFRVLRFRVEGLWFRAARAVPGPAFCCMDPFFNPVQLEVAQKNR